MHLLFRSCLKKIRKVRAVWNEVYFHFIETWEKLMQFTNFLPFIKLHAPMTFTLQTKHITFSLIQNPSFPDRQAMLLFWSRSVDLTILNYYCIEVVPTVLQLSDAEFHAWIYSSRWGKCRRSSGDRERGPQLGNMEGNGKEQWEKCVYGVKGCGIRTLICAGLSRQQGRMELAEYGIVTKEAGHWFVMWRTKRYNKGSGKQSRR